MANLAKSKTLFAFTSPRTIEKIIPEIEILVGNFSGKKWSGNSGLQADFFNILFESEYYEGETRPSDPALAARDRITRAPKALGFVDLTPRIALTPAGERLLKRRRGDEVITRQLLKFQLPSPYHTDSENRYFIKPYLELIRLVRDLGGLTKTEVALFFVQMIHIDQYEEIKARIEEFRKARRAFNGNRKAFILQQHDLEIETIYESEIRSNRFETRESAGSSKTKFFKTKRANMLDYADAFIRYLRATGLVTINARQARVVISEYRAEEVEFILDTVPREPTAFRNSDEFKRTLFDPAVPILLGDDRERLINKIGALSPLTETVGYDIEDLKNELEEIEERARRRNVETTKARLKTYEEHEDVMAVFSRIENRELPDLPLFFEWNIWRSMAMLNYGQIDGNFLVDTDGAPLGTAASNRPDIECEYESFKLIIEVTMSSGHKQYEMEGEPVARHYGTITKTSDKDVYCLFVAPVVSEATIAHFFMTNRTNIKFYGGKTRIIPIDLPTFKKFVNSGVAARFSDPSRLEAFLSSAVTSGRYSEDEVQWKSHIEEIAASWLH